MDQATLLLLIVWARAPLTSPVSLARFPPLPASSPVGHFPQEQWGANLVCNPKLAQEAIADEDPNPSPTTIVMARASQQVAASHVAAFPEQATPLPLFTVLVVSPLQPNGVVMHVAGASQQVAA